MERKDSKTIVGYLLTIVNSLDHDGLGVENYLYKTRKQAVALAKKKQKEFCKEFEIKPTREDTYSYVNITEDNSQELVCVAENEDTGDRMYVVIACLDGQINKTAL